MTDKFQAVDAVKWVATVSQLIGYGMTGKNLLPDNVYIFFLGILLWFADGIMRKDKAIMVVEYVWKGWLEDRRPASNGDPYKIAARIVQTVKGAE